MTTYFLFRRKQYHPDVGSYFSYDIAAYGPLIRGPIQVIRDVSTDGDLVFRMIRAFNEHRLSPVHFRDAVLDALE